SQIAHRLDRLLQDHIRLATVAREDLAYHADARTLQAVLIQELAVVGERLTGAPRGHRIAWIDTGDRAEYRCRIGDGARHRPDRILGVRDRNDAGTAGQPDGRLDPHDPVVVRGADDRAIRLGAERGSRQVGRDGLSRAGA